MNTLTVQEEIRNKVKSEFGIKSVCAEEIIDIKENSTVKPIYLLFLLLLANKGVERCTGKVI